MKRTVLIAMVSWEDRFLGGLRRLLEERRPAEVILCWYDHKESRTTPYRDTAMRLCRDATCDVEGLRLRYGDPVDSWRTIRERVARMNGEREEVIIDISTMAREAIWAFLLLLDQQSVSGSYAYHRPRGYGEWLSRDPGEPRLVLKLGGEMKFGRETVVVVVTGFDRERTEQVVRVFDPAVIELAVQSGRQFGNSERNATELKGLLQAGRDPDTVKSFSMDAYLDDHGFAMIADRVARYVGSKNVIMASLGPKLSAVALYRVQRKFRSTGLVYAPSREYNEEYSTGIGNVVGGNLPVG